MSSVLIIRKENRIVMMNPCHPIRDQRGPVGAHGVSESVEGFEPVQFILWVYQFGIIKDFKKINIVSDFINFLIPASNPKEPSIIVHESGCTFVDRNPESSFMRSSLY